MKKNLKRIHGSKLYYNKIYKNNKSNLQFITDMT